MSCLKNKIVKTNKEHVCFGCERVFPKGSQLRNTTHTEDMKSVYWCKTCDAVFDELHDWQTEDGFLFGELKDNYIDIWEDCNARDKQL